MQITYNGSMAEVSLSVDLTAEITAGKAEIQAGRCTLEQGAQSLEDLTVLKLIKVLQEHREKITVTTASLDAQIAQCSALITELETKKAQAVSLGSTDVLK